MKKFLLSFIGLCFLTNWMPMSAEADAPTVTITAPSDAQTGDFNITIAFSENVDGFALSDITLTPSTLAGVISLNGGDGDSSFTATIRPNAGQSGTLTIDVAAAVATATTGGESNTAATSKTVEVALPKPTLTIDPPSGTQTSAFDVDFTFSESVMGFESGDIGLTNNARVTNLTGSGASYTATIKPKVTGNVTISVAANVATNTGGQGNTAATDQTVTVDLPHQIMVMEPDGDEPHNAAFDVTVMFTESVGGFVAGDITLTPNTMATVGTPSGSAPTYTVTITPADNQDGTLSIQIANAAVQDNESTPMDYPASNTVTVDIDTVDPQVTSITGPSDTQNGNFDVTITFDEEVDDFDASDLTVSGGASAPSRWSTGSDGDTEYTGTIDISGVSTGNSNDVTISVGSNKAEDEAGNGNSASASSVDLTVTVDNKKPTPTIGSISGTKNAAFTISITFDESVSNFGASDISLSKQSGTAGGTASGVTGSGTTYSATITPTGMGTLRMSITAGAAEDAAGNTSKVSANVDVTVDAEDPTVMITAPTATQNGAFDATFTFNEAVTGFTPSDVSVTNANKAANWKSGATATTYTLTLTPTTADGSTGTVTINVAANAAQDSGNNGNAAATQVTVSVDKANPTVTIDAPTTDQKDPFDVTFTFSEGVTGFTPSDVTVTNANKANSWKSGETATVYELTLTPTIANGSTGTVTINVPANSATDAATNGNTAASQASVSVDKQRPTVSITGVPTTEQKGAFDLTITFSETVTGFAATDLMVTGEATAAVSGSGSGYTATITPNANKEGDVTVKVKANVVTDGAGNNNTASTVTGNIHIDTIVPTATISGVPTTEQKEAFDLTITFNETVTGFAKTDLTVTGEATATAVSGSGSSYTATITPNANKEGDVTVKVKANVVTDGAGNNNTASTVTGNIHIDTIVPTATISGVPTTEQKEAFDLTITFNETVTGFAKTDLTVTGEATATAVSGSGSSYTATITPNANKEDDVKVRIRVNAVTDAAGNNSTASAFTPNIHIDTIVPTVAISGVPTTEQKGAFDLTITFSEDVNGFATGDLTVTGEASATAVSGSGSSYTATITPNANKEGDVTVKVNADTVTDAAQNNNTASTVTGNIHIDTIVPTATISGVPTTEQKSAFNLTITFNETVTGFAKEDLTVTGEATATAVSGSGSSYTATITPNAAKEGDVTVKVNANAVKDAANNDNPVSAATGNIHIDTIVPTVAISNVPTIEKNVAYDLTVTFSEPVNGFAVPADLTVTGPGVASLKSGTAGDSVYTVTITPNATSEGDVAVSVNASTVQDMALNANTAGSNTATVHIDTIVPTVSVSGFPTIEKNVAYDLTVTFSEAVNGFAAGDVTVSGPAAATLKSGADGDTEYTVTITPNANAEGGVTVTVNANTVKDLALNNNTASTETTSVHVDTIVPTVSVSGFPTIEKNVAYDLTVTFSEVVNGFAVPADLTVTGPAAATLKSGADGDSVYTVTITPNATSEGDVTVTVNADTVKDAALNDNTASTETTSVHVDTIVPTVAISNIPTIEKNVPYDLTVTFSEDVNGFAVPGDLTVTGPGVATLKSGTAGDAAYTVTITPNATSEGDVAVTVNASTVQDMALNANSAGSNTATVHVDTIPPTVSVSGFPTIEKNVAYDLTVTFSEVVNGFAVPADLTVTGPATASLASGADGDAVYTVTITPNATSEGDVTVAVNANTVQDMALNANPAGSPETDVVHVDTIPPTVSVSGFPPASPEQNGPFTLTVTFSEEVNGFAVPADLTLTGPVTAALTSGADGDAVYTVTITPNATSEGDVTVAVNANTVQDMALNANPAGSPETDVVHVDTIPPTVSMVVTPPVEIGQDTGYPTEERNAAYTLTVTFSEEVNGFTVPGDLTVTGPGAAALTSGADGDIVYTVTITPDATSEGDVTVTVNANAIQDFATNSNPAGSLEVPVHIDTIPPTFTIEDVPVLQRLNAFFDIDIVFDEAVNGFQVPADFVASDLVVPSVVSGADGASTYTVRMTPNEDVQGDLFIEVNAEAVQDFALNLNAAPVVTTQPVRIDTIAPTVEITDLPTGAKSEPFDITITFAEVVNGFTTEDIALVGPATIALTAGTDGDAVYTARITPNPNANGTVTLQIPAAVVEDFARNPNLPSLLTEPIAINTNALTVELQDVPETVQLDTFSVIIAFSNDVEGFVLGDIEITGDAVVLSATLLGTGRAYTLTVTPEENTDGDVIITVPAGVVQDATGKSNTASVPQIIAVAPKWAPDAELRDAFREQLDLEAGTDLTQQQLRTITTVESEMSGMRDLTGLEQATALTTLVLPENEITDLTPLRRLTKLTTLNLASNAVTNITPLAGLTALTSLNLSGNGLTDIAPLEDLTNLTVLDLSDNALTDISTLENFTQLTTLNLSGNRITDISPLTSLTSLTTLNLNGNPIGDFTPLTGLTTLTTLELGGTGLSSLDVISGLTGLTALNLSDNRLTAIARLANLTALTKLNLSGNTIVDITPLSSLTSLRTLELADNAITTLTPLTALTLLTYLDVSENGITEVAPLLALANLRTLRLMGNPILNTAPLYPLTQRVPPVAIDIAVSQYPPWDVNEDGTVDASDSALVTAALGQTGDAIENPRTDVNGDGTVDNADVLLITANLDGGVAGAPAMKSLLSQLDTETFRTLDRVTLETYLNQLRLESDGSLKYRNAIALLEGLLAALRPTETRLLANYPNPFNPETWLPYELAVDTTVEIFIYNARGVLVRHLELGHQPAGYYVAKSRAAYWDGRNRVGERVSSGVYFYELRAGDVSQLRKMVILK